MSKRSQHVHSFFYLSITGLRLCQEDTTFCRVVVSNNVAYVLRVESKVDVS